MIINKTRTNTSTTEADLPLNENARIIRDRQSRKAACKRPCSLKQVVNGLVISVKFLFKKTAPFVCHFHHHRRNHQQVHPNIYQNFFTNDIKRFAIAARIFCLLLPFRQRTDLYDQE